MTALRGEAVNAAPRRRVQRVLYITQREATRRYGLVSRFDSRAALFEPENRTRGGSRCSSFAPRVVTRARRRRSNSSNSFRAATPTPRPGQNPPLPSVPGTDARENIQSYRNRIVRRPDPSSATTRILPSSARLELRHVSQLARELALDIDPPDLRPRRPPHVALHVKRHHAHVLERRHVELDLAVGRRARRLCAALPLGPRSRSSDSARSRISSPPAARSRPRARASRSRPAILTRARPHVRTRTPRAGSAPRRRRSRASTTPRSRGPGHSALRQLSSVERVQALHRALRRRVRSRSRIARRGVAVVGVAPRGRSIRRRLRRSSAEVSVRRRHQHGRHTPPRPPYMGTRPPVNTSPDLAYRARETRERTTRRRARDRLTWGRDPLEYDPN